MRVFIHTKYEGGPIAAKGLFVFLTRSKPKEKNENVLWRRRLKLFRHKFKSRFFGTLTSGKKFLSTVPKIITSIRNSHNTNEILVVYVWPLLDFPLLEHAIDISQCEFSFKLISETLPWQLINSLLVHLPVNPYEKHIYN